VAVLVVAVPAAGHVNPLLPLAGALLAQGHDVAVACGEDPGRAIGRSGAEHVPAGSGEREWFDVLRSRVRGVPGDGLAPERINYYFVPRLFADIGAADMVDDVVRIGERLRPDLLLFETYAFAGPLAADILGVPAVHHLISPMLAHEVMALADDALSPLWRSFGRPSPGWGGVYRALTLEVSPRSLEPLSVPTGESLRIRPVPLPLRARRLSDPPLVYLTLGTFFSANSEVFRTVLEALQGVHAEVVVTVGADGDPGQLGPVPDNVRVERFIPQGELLPRCSLILHHGGSGTMFGALAHAVPQIVIPQGADNFLNASLIERCGAGTSILPDSFNAAEISRCIDGVLGDTTFATNAEKLAGELAAMSGPDEVARLLTELAK
jgi:UDP:flavonoid glycosyltransferase YjiC (YdhE family)